MKTDLTQRPTDELTGKVVAHIERWYGAEFGKWRQGRAPCRSQFMELHEPGCLDTSHFANDPREDENAAVRLLGKLTLYHCLFFDIRETGWFWIGRRGSMEHVAKIPSRGSEFCNAIVNLYAQFNDLEKIA